MKRFLKLVFIGFLSVVLYGCKNKASSSVKKEPNLYLYNFYVDKKETRTVNRENVSEDESKIEFEIGNALIPCEALVVNKERDSFIDIVVYMSWSNKYVVYNEGNGDYRCSSTTEFDGEVWKTRINFDIKIFSDHDQNGYISVNDISFLHSGSQKINAELNHTKNSSISYHEHRYTEKNEQAEYVYQERDHFHATRYYYSCSCGLSEKHQNMYRYFEKEEQPIQHVFDQQVIDQKYYCSPATCYEPSKYYFSCICGACGDLTFDYGSPRGHVMGPYVSDKNETMTEDGTETSSCYYCSYKDTKQVVGSAIENGSFHNLIFATGNRNDIEGYVKYYNDDRDNHIVLPSNTLNIYSGAFKNCTEIEEVTIPKSIQSIGNDAFNGCSSLRNVSFVGEPNEADFYCLNIISSTCFANCTSLERISLPAFEFVRADIFEGCSNLKDVVLEGSIKQSDCKNMFKGCVNLQYLNMTIYGIEDFTVLFSGDENIPDNLNIHLRGVGLKDASVDRNKVPFRNVTKRINVSFSDELKYLANYFTGCLGIYDIELPYGLITIRPYTFYGCTNLRKFIIPDTVKGIGEQAYGGFVGIPIEEIVVPGDCALLSSCIFDYYASENQVKITGTLVRDEYTYRSTLSGGSEGFPQVFKRGGNVKRIYLEDTIKKLGFNSLRGFSRLEEIDMPGGIESMDYGAFDFTNMKEIFIRSNYDPNNKTLLSLQNIPYSNFDEYDITVKFADGTQYYKGEVTYN